MTNRKKFKASDIKVGETFEGPHGDQIKVTALNADNVHGFIVRENGERSSWAIEKFLQWVNSKQGRA